MCRGGRRTKKSLTLRAAVPFVTGGAWWRWKCRYMADLIDRALEFGPYEQDYVTEQKVIARELRDRADADESG